MKILHINEHLEWAGGVETYLLSIIPELEKRGHGQAFAFAKGRSELVSESYHLPSLSFGDRKSEQTGFVEISQLLDKVQPDIVHLHQIYNTGAIKACLGQVPVFVHAHDYRYVCPSSTFYYKRTQEECHRTSGPGCFTTTLRKHCLTPRPKYALDYYRRVRWFEQQSARISTVIAPSDSARKRYIAAGFNAEKIHVLPYFCSLEANQAPRKLPKEPTILFIGRIRPNKGVDTFVEAFSRLPGSTRALMIGDFSGQSHALVESQATRLGCLDRMELQGWVNRDQIRDVFERATVFVFPSLWPETLGIVGLEALACGVPVVASDIGGVREWLIDGETGYLAEPKNAVDFAEKIEKLLLDMELNVQFGRNGQQLIRERFTPEYHINKLLDVYEAGITNGRGAPRH